MSPDIEKRTFDFSMKLISFCRDIQNKDLANQIILKQLLRAGTSIGANTIEGRASSSKKDFINFHYHALKSCRETMYWLRLLEATPLIGQQLERCGELLKEAREISNILGRIVISSRSNV